MNLTPIQQIIEDIIQVEGGYVNDENDSGGETCWGITIETARAHGYTGPMKDLPKQVARDIYTKSYVNDPGFDKVSAVSMTLARELVDTGVNMGQTVAAKWLQLSLNAFNLRGTKYPDLVVDGNIGQKTIDALKTYISWRGKDAERVMLVGLNCLQGARYIELSQQANQKNEDFVFGWLKNRVSDQI